MKQLSTIFFFTLFSSMVMAQSSSAVTKWEFNAVGENKIEINVTLNEGWHIYSQYLVGDGPIPTTFTFQENNNIELKGKVKEEKAITEYDANFDMQVAYFKHETKFTQEIVRKSKDKTALSGTVEFMVCNETMCYPPDVISFKIELP